MPINIDSVERILQYTATYGLAYVFLFFCLMGALWIGYEIIKFFRKWGPLIVEKHITLLDTLKDSTEVQTENNSRTTSAIEVLAQGRSEYDARTHRALRHFALAARESTTQDAVKHHFEEALHELRDQT